MNCPVCKQVLSPTAEDCVYICSNCKKKYKIRKPKEDDIAQKTKVGIDSFVAASQKNKSEPATTGSSSVEQCTTVPKKTQESNSTSNLQSKNGAESSQGMLPKQTVRQPAQQNMQRIAKINVGATTSTVAQSKVGKTLSFGMYPQSRIKDESLENTLGGFSENWKKFECKPNGKNSNYVFFYMDKVYGGIKYRGIFFPLYRSSFGTDGPVDKSSYQYLNGYRARKVYWFQYEPIRWLIVADDNNYLTLVSELILDSQEYYSSDSLYSTVRNDYQGNEGTVYANNYQFSLIREFLNTSFLNTAFSADEQAVLVEQEIDNSCLSTGLEFNDCACNNTCDRVWLLSHADVQKVFSDKTARMKKGTDYAKCQGLWVNKYNNDLTSAWWLRSPSYSTNSVRGVYEDGDIAKHTANVRFTAHGILPVIKVKQ